MEEKQMLLAERLDSLSLNGFENLKVEVPSFCGVEYCIQDSEVTLTTKCRSVSHGNVSTAWARYPITGVIHKDDTIVVHLQIKNKLSNPTNFLVDLFSASNGKSWLFRNPIFFPTCEEYQDCYFYGYATEDTDSAVFEISLGYAEQSICVSNVEAAVYPGPVRENLMEVLPGMSRSANGKRIWHRYYGADEHWREKAEEMITLNRKGKISVAVVDGRGNPIPNCSVRFSMKEHDYLFGTAVSAEDFLGENRDKKIQVLKDYFNIVTLANDLKWERGEVKPYALEALKYLAQNNMKVHGHVLLWPGIDRDPYDDGIDNSSEFIVTPDYIIAFVHVIAAMQKMNDPRTGYGDGTVRTLRSEVNAAIDVLTGRMENLIDPVVQRHLQEMNDMVCRVREGIVAVSDSETCLPELQTILADLQALLRKVVIEHVSSFASYYAQGDSIAEWDVFNEIFNFGNRGVTNALGEDIGTFDGRKTAADGGAYKNQIFVDILNAAHEASGGVPLSYNDTSWQSNVLQREWTYKFMKWLKEQQAPIGFMGLQAYIFPESIDAIVDPEESWKEYDKLFDLGIETEITEYGFERFGSVCKDNHMLRNLKADFMTDYILANFAHPSSRGYIAWGGIPTKGPLSSVFYKLVYDRLWTNESVATDCDGIAEIEGFLGKYEISVLDDQGNAHCVQIAHSANNVSGDMTDITLTV